jgi:predicted HTH transcriptional regulator
MAGALRSTSRERMRPVSRPDGERRKLAATVAAFANGSGGTIVYGVENDTLTAISVHGTQESLDSLQRVIRNRLEPQPEVSVEMVATRGVTVIAGGGVQGHRHSIRNQS